MKKEKFYDVDTNISNIEEAYLKSQIQVVNQMNEGLIQRTPITIYARDTKETNYFLNSMKSMFYKFGIPCVTSLFNPNTISLDTLVGIINNTVGAYIYVRVDESKRDLDLISQFVKKEGDIDGVSYELLNSHFLPAVVRATINIISHKYQGLDLKGKTVLLVNRSSYVGMPLHYVLTQQGATVLQANSTTPKEVLDILVSKADIQIWATGVKGIADEYVDQGELVIDLSQRDVQREAVMPDKVCKVTGKLTCLSLIRNYLEALPTEPLTQNQN